MTPVGSSRDTLTNVRVIALPPFIQLEEIATTQVDEHLRPRSKAIRIKTASFKKPIVD